MAQPQVDERTPLLPASTASAPESDISPGDGQLSASRKRVIVALTLLTGFLSTLDLTSEQPANDLHLLTDYSISCRNQHLDHLV
jgi:hypothetical protein